MLILSPTMVMAERHDHGNKRASQAQYNDRFYHGQRHYNNHNRHHGHKEHYNHRYYARNHHNRHHGHKEHYNHGYYARNHHNHYQPGGIILGIQSGNFGLILRD